MLTQGPKRTNYPAVEGRVSFMHHDFFSPQPVRAANLSSSLLFFIRQGIHNYNDERSVEIFKNLVPGMQEGEEVRLLINDMVLPEMNELPKVEEHHLRQLDIAMLNGYAAKQRTLAQFETLLKRADERKAGFYHPNGQRPGSMFTEGGHLLREDARLFDNAFFGLTATEATSMDPSQRKLLEVTYEVFESAGEPWDRFSGSRTGVFIGNFNNEHQVMQFRDLDHPLPYVVTGGGATILSNRISHVFNLRGPSMVIDTACSASMYALYMAVLSLRNQDYDAAIVGGGNLILNPDAQLFTTKLNAISPTSRSHTFDASADGYSRAEGFGAVYIKRLSDALANGDPIRAIIRGTSCNANGRTGGISHPSPEGQEECHGTGTPVGDPIEVKAIGRVFASSHQDEPLLIGSIKPSLSHSEPASALAQIMKVILAMKHGEIPATVGVQTLNPAIDFQTARAKVVTSATPWTSGRLRRVSINSFGYGGANAHCILDHPSILLSEGRIYSLPLTNGNHQGQPHPDPVPGKSSNGLTDGSINGVTNGSHSINWHPSPELVQTQESATLRRLVLVPLSAFDEQALDTYVKQIQESAHKFELRDLLYTLGARRSTFSRRAFALTDGPSWSIEEVLQEEAATSRIHEPAFSQAVCTALQVALVNLLEVWGINPAATVGHSSGEIAAAYGAGRIKASEAIVIAYYRGQAVTTNQQDGLMIAVGLGAEESISYLTGLENRVTVVALNSPDSTTISGDSDAIRTLSERLTTEKIFNRVLKTGGNAYHSHHMLKLGEAYEQNLSRGLLEVATIGENEPPRPHTTWVSSVNTKKEADATSPRYWRQNLEAPVRFAEAIAGVASDAAPSLMIEVGPHPALTGPISQIRTKLAPTLPSCLASLRRGDDDLKSMLTLAGQFYATDIPLSTCLRMPYSYAEKPLYHENRFNRELRQRQSLRHDLLGARQPGGSKTHPTWRNVLRAKDVPWLDHHKLGPNTVLPAAGYIAMAVEAVWQIYGEQAKSILASVGSVPPIRSYKLRNVSITSAMKLLDKNNEYGVEMILNLGRLTSSAGATSNAHTDSGSTVWYKFSIGSMPVTGNGAGAVPGSETWTEHCTGTIAYTVGTATETDQISKVSPLKIDPLSRTLDTRCWYDKFEEVGLGFGESFQCLSRLQAYRSSSVAAADVALDSTLELFKATPGEESEYHALHPAVLDACLQLTLIAMHKGQVENCERAFMPAWLSDVTLARAVATGNFLGQRSAYGQAQLFAASGSPLVDIKELKCVMFDAIGTVDKGSRQLEREPYWKAVSKIDVSSLTNERAKAVFPPLENPEFDIRKMNQLCSFIVADIKRPMAKKGTEEQLSEQSSFRARLNTRSEVSSSHGEAEVQDTEDLQRHIKAMLAELSHIPEVRYIENIYGNMRSILSQEGNGSHHPMLDKHILDELYRTGIFVSGAYTRVQCLVDLHAHKNPRMRVLELRGRTGGATAALKQALYPNGSFKRFDQYVFTDPDREYVTEAQKRLAAYSGVTCQVFDIGNDPEAQGFALDSFDLIISTPGALVHQNGVDVALRNIHVLLKPGGTLIFVEPVRDDIGLEMISWSINDSWNREGPRIRDPDEWRRILLEANFSAPQLVLDDYAGEGVVYTTFMTQTPSAPLADSGALDRPERIVYLVYRDYPGPLARYISRALESDTRRCKYVNLLSHEIIPSDAWVISLVDLDSSTVLHRGAEYFQAIQALISKSSVLIWLAHRQEEGIDGTEPAVMKGILRSVAAESILLSSCYVELSDGASFYDWSRISELVSYKLEEISQTRPSFDEVGERVIDRDCLFRDGVFYTERLTPAVDLNNEFRLRHRLTDDYLEESLLDGKQALKPSYSRPGLLSSLYFEPDPLKQEPLEEGWIEIKAKAVGLNRKDIAVATGRFDSNNQNHEAAGIITRVGPGVTSLKEGDRVFGLVFSNMGMYQRCPAQRLAIIPATESFISAASLPVSYLAALILIESAAENIGIAAIQLAKYYGLNIYATVGSDAKRDFLVETFGLETSQILRSRRRDLPEIIMRETGGRGIDIIFSTTAQGDMMHEMWRCIAPLGRFIDMGRTGVLGAEKLGMEVLKRNATFASFDISSVALEKPQIIEQLMAELKAFWEQGVLGPVAPITCFELAELSTAMSSFTKGQHIGKIVIDFGKSTIPAQVARNTSHARFDPDAAYLLVGCLGGLGRSLSTWMVERGARHVVFLSRSGAQTPDIKSFLARLEDMGGKPEVHPCDITDYDALASVVALLSSKWSIKGLVHAAMAEGDKLFNQTTYAQVQAVLAPKVTGTVNLDKATKGLPLDFFLMFSSVVGVIGTATQSAYCGANSFQSEFARRRRAQGLPATSLDLGLILEIGRVSTSESENVQKSLQRVATYGQSETEFWQLVEGALCAPQNVDEGHVITGLEPVRLLAHAKDRDLSHFMWHGDARFQSIVQGVRDKSGSSHPSAELASGMMGQGRSLAQRLEEVSSRQEKTAIVQEEVVKHFAELLGRRTDDIDGDRAMSHYGLDSLLAAELRSWFLRSFGLELTALHLLSEMATAKSLASMAMASLEDTKQMKR
ncbi:putative polyketide synthase [Xylariaceae sp. FL0594]|nr:putative polyketide synthase [Xylariaceae sp. FL0594]